jgi:anti-sigma-K factor RskA
MSWRLTPQEKRIIEQTRRQGEELYAGETPAERKTFVWRSVVVWVATIVAFALLATLIVYIGTLF